MLSQSHVPHCRVLPLGGEFTVVIPEPHAILQGAVTWRNQCHDRATLQGVLIPSAILKIVFRHILFFVFFKIHFGLWRAAAFISSLIHLYRYRQVLGGVSARWRPGGARPGTWFTPDYLHFSGISEEVVNGFRWHFIRRRLLKNACMDLHEM